MEYLYKKDKAKALAYLAAEKQISVTYRSQTEESRQTHKSVSVCNRWTQMKMHNLAPQISEVFSITAENIVLICSDVIPPGGKGKGKSKKTTFKGIGRFEVRYSDGVWYKGTLIDFNVKTGSWVAKFDADNEATTIKFPDKDVRLI